jgi:8-oxo-dGTP diphosphatase
MKSKQPPVGRGVIGILNRGPAYLVVRRATGVAKAGFWCFPGGHVEPGETPRRAVQRELAEELGIEVAPVRRVGSVRVINRHRYILAVWVVHRLRGELRIAESEIAEARWLRPSEIRAIRPNLPSNFRVLEMLGV